MGNASGKLEDEGLLSPLMEGSHEVIGRPLIYACERKIIPLALERLSSGSPLCDPGLTTLFGDTALMWCYANRLTDLGLRILETGKANVGQINALGNTALLLACGRQNETLALEILKQGRKANLKQMNNSGYTALSYAIIKGLPKVVRMILELDPACASGLDKDHNTPLIYASYHKQEAIGLMLLGTNQARPEHINKAGATALLLSCGQGLSALAKAIFMTGQSSPGVADPIYGRTALMLAIDRGMADLASIMIDSGTFSPKPQDAPRPGPWPKV